MFTSKIYENLWTYMNYRTGNSVNVVDWVINRSSIIIKELKENAWVLKVIRLSWQMKNEKTMTKKFMRIKSLSGTNASRRCRRAVGCVVFHCARHICCNSSVTLVAPNTDCGSSRGVGNHAHTNRRYGYRFSI